jgi:hypothetical protein
MNRFGWPQLGAIAAVAASVAVAVVLLLVLAPGWSGGGGGSYAPRATVVETRLDPPSALFGDQVMAIARIVVDAGKVDPASVTLDPTFKPFQAFDTTRTVRDGIGRAAEITFAFRLQCVAGACIRAMEREERGGRIRTVPIALPKATVRAKSRDGEPVAVDASWPTLVMHSRLTAEAIQDGTPDVAAFAAPPVKYPVAPDVLGWLLIAAAAVFVVVAGWFVARSLATVRRERPLRLPANLTPAERALALARHALDGGDMAGGRKALERLAAELERGGRDDLAQAAGRTAWSSRGPSMEIVDELTVSVRSSNGH